MKKLLALVLCLAMVFSFAACGETETTSSGDNSTGNVTTEKVAYVLAEKGDT